VLDFEGSPAISAFIGSGPPRDGRAGVFVSGVRFGNREPARAASARVECDRERRDGQVEADQDRCDRGQAGSPDKSVRHR
jgi:hypothetical protein